MYRSYRRYPSTTGPRATTSHETCQQQQAQEQESPERDCESDTDYGRESDAGFDHLMIHVVAVGVRFDRASPAATETAYPHVHIAQETPRPRSSLMGSEAVFEGRSGTLALAFVRTLGVIAKGISKFLNLNYNNNRKRRVGVQVFVLQHK